MPAYALFVVPLLIAVFLAFNMGASGTAPSFAVAYGANLIRKELIPGLFGAFVLLGALIAGGKVVQTIGGAVLPAAEMSLVVVSIVLLSSALSLLFANLLRVPQSTSQSTVFALVGCAAFLGSLQTGTLLLEMVPTWFVTPIAAFVITYTVGGLLMNMKKKRLAESFDIAEGPQRKVLQAVTIACSCYVAFAIGSNNVANSAGPLASLLVNELGMTVDGSELIAGFLVVILIAPWFGIGSSFLGGRVLASTGRGIVSLGPTGATFIAFVTATLLLLASTVRGVPASLVQMNTAAIIAVGMLKKGPRRILSRGLVLRMVAIWMIAPLMALVISYALTALASSAGLL